MIDFLEEYKIIFEIIAYCSAVVAIILTIFQIRSGQRKLLNELSRRNKDCTLEYLEGVRDDIRINQLNVRKRFQREFGEILSDEDAKVAQVDTDIRNDVLFILSKFERIGVACKLGIYDDEIVFHLSRSLVLNVFAFYSSYIRLARQRVSTAYVGFEELAKKFEKRSLTEGLNLPAAYSLYLKTAAL